MQWTKEKKLELLTRIRLGEVLPEGAYGKSSSYPWRTTTSWNRRCSEGRFWILDTLVTYTEVHGNVFGHSTIRYPDGLDGTLRVWEDALEWLAR